MPTVSEVLAKIPNSLQPTNFMVEGSLIDSKYSYIKSQITADDHIIRGMAILLQNINLSLLTPQDLEVLTTLNYHLLIVPTTFDYRTNYLSPSNTYSDLMDGVVRSQLQLDNNMQAYSYGLATLNMQLVNLTELVGALS
jgi:hypothetical protein